MTILRQILKHSVCNVFRNSITLVTVEGVDMWITQKTAREKTKLQKREVERKRWPLQSKTKTQQCFTDLKTKAQVREKNGRRSKSEYEESNLLLVDNLVDKMWITFKRIKCNRYHMKKNRACNRYHILKKVATIL